MKVRPRTVSAVAPLAVLVAATGYELALALGGLSIGAEPGRGAYGSGIVEGAATIAIVLGITLAAASMIRPRADRQLDGALAVTAAAFTTVRFYTFDPYYAPTLRRMSDHGLVSPDWIFGLLALAIIVAVVAHLVEDSGPPLTVVVLLLCLGTVLVEGAGH